MPRAPLLLSLIAPLVAAQEPYSPHVEPASDEGAQAMAKIDIPEGFRIHLWAAEPMLANPVAFTVDDGGDVYVAESFRVHAGVTDMREHMDWLADELSNTTVADRVAMYAKHEGENFASYGTEHERIRLLRDTDGDGTADEAIVFADGFQDPADGIAAGLLTNGGDVYYTCIPHLWLLRDEDGDGKADVRAKLSSGYGVHVALLGHDLHGLRIGPDGRLYFSSGDRGFHVETENGVIAHPHTGAVLRCDLDGKNLEVFHTGLRNPQELAFDDHGNLFTGDNNSDGGDQARWVQIVEGADSGWRFYYQYVTEPVMRGPWNDEKLWHPWHAGQPAYVLPPIANLGNGPSGLTYYPGTGLPESYREHFFLCDFRGDAQFSGIHTFTNVPKGAGFELGPVEWFVHGALPTDCEFGPDGSFYVSDWVHGWNMTGKGRIFSVSHPESLLSPAVRDVQAMLRDGLGDREEAQLLELLRHSDRRIRQEAQFELVRRKSRGLQFEARSSSNMLLARLHAIWGLGMLSRSPGLRSNPLEHVYGLLYDPEPEVRAQAAKVLGDERYEPAGQELLRMISTDEHPRVRMYAALALGRLQMREAAGELFALLHYVGDSDPVLRHAVVMGLAGCATREDVEARMDHDSLHVRMGCVLVLRRWHDPRIQRFLDDPDLLVVREAATAIHDEMIWEALPALGALIHRPGLRGNALVRRVLNVHYWFASEENARELAAFALRDDQEEAHRAEALALLADWSEPSKIDRVLGRWIELEPRDASFVPAIVADLARRGVADAPTAVVEAWIDVAAATRTDAVADALSALVIESERPASTRTAALRALETLATPDLREIVAAALADPDGDVRAAGLDALLRLAPQDALPLLEAVLVLGDWPERRVVYRALGTLEDPLADEMLLAEVGKLAGERVPAELALDLVVAAEARGNEALDRALAERAAARTDAELAPYLDSLLGGNRTEGRRIFRNDLELSCLRCHRDAEEGVAQIGPDLVRLGERLTRLQILEAIVVPNRYVSAGYETTVFFLVDDGMLSGRIVAEDEGSVTIVDSEGVVVTIDVDEIDERRAGLSAMPNDLVKSLTREELRDLIQYLASL